MEETKPAQGQTTTQVVYPPSSAQAPPSVSGLPPKSKKRPLEGNLQIENSKYFKMRLVVKDLRPHFLEVLQTPDFQNCKAADEIREKMKLVIELYQQMTGETTKQENTPKSSETSSFQAGNVLEKHQAEDGVKTGTYVVGGSAFGWNFITVGGTEPVYYGVTKVSFRNANPIRKGQ